MRPSSRISYALRALVDLALHQGTGPVTVGSVAKRQGIPIRYLEQLLNRLRREGIVIAERGPRGGYRLSRPPSQIPISAVFHCLESEQGLSPKGTVPVRSSKGTVPCRSPKRAVPASDPTASLWKQVETAVQTTLQATTLENLVAQARDNARILNHRYTFHI